MLESSRDSTRSDVWAEVGSGRESYPGNLSSYRPHKVAEGNQLFDNITEATVTPTPRSVPGKKRDSEE